MKHLRFIIVGLAFVFLIYVVFVVYQNRNSAEAPNIQANIPTNQEKGGKQQWETKTDDRPPVTVRVTPIELGKDSQLWKFDIVLDTHSVDLGKDLTKVSVLIDENGNEYKPISWEGDPPGGHHRRGILKFNPILPQPDSITLKIFRIGGIEERNFTWQIK